jgi:hypothetical protein
VNVNNLQKRAWVQKKLGKMPLRKKGAGRAIHISDFIVEETGWLHLSPEQVAEQMAKPQSERLAAFDSRVIMYPGKNYDGWWTGEKLLDQVCS